MVDFSSRSWVNREAFGEYFTDEETETSVPPVQKGGSFADLQASCRHGPQPPDPPNAGAGSGQIWDVIGLLGLHLVLRQGEADLISIAVGCGPPSTAL